MDCPDRPDGVHDLTRGLVCSCGYKNEPTRYAVSIQVHDNETQSDVIDDCFNTNGLSTVTHALRNALRKLELKGF